MNNIIAQMMGVLGTISNIIGIQLKKKSQIMISIILANFFFSLNFLLLEAYSGAIICFIAGIQTFINYLFDIKKKKYPIWLITIYYLISLVSVLITFTTLIDIIPIICAILLITTIIQKKERNIRLLTLVNIGLWSVYDLTVGAYTAAISDAFMTISTLIAITRLDILKNNKNKVST